MSVSGDFETIPISTLLIIFSQKNNLRIGYTDLGIWRLQVDFNGAKFCQTGHVSRALYDLLNIWFISFDEYDVSKTVPYALGCYIIGIEVYIVS